MHLVLLLQWVGHPSKEWLFHMKLWAMHSVLVSCAQWYLLVLFIHFSHSQHCWKKPCLSKYSRHHMNYRYLTADFPLKRSRWCIFILKVATLLVWGTLITGLIAQYTVLPDWREHDPGLQSTILGFFMWYYHQRSIWLRRKLQKNNNNKPAIRTWW